MAGAFAGGCSSFIVAPTDRVKVLLQIQGQGTASSPANYKGSIDCARQLGPTSLFRGFSATLARDVPGYACYFFFYEYVKTNLVLSDPSAPSYKSAGAVLVAGATAGVLNWLAVSPFDVIKSRMQANSSGGFAATAKTVFVEGGALGFYRGIGPSLVRAVPANAACMAGVEIGKACWRAIDGQ
jgi:solute carrier family 25 carnitine/acylcarnitine transporter 20/29